MRGPKVTRRAVLAGVSATVTAPTAPAFADSDLSIAAENSGFVVRVRHQEVWRVNGEQIRTAWGSAASVTVAPEGPTPSATITGNLLARDATLVLWFERWRTGWHCRMRLGVGRLPKVTAVAPVGQGDDANQPMFTAVLPSFYPWSDAACVPKHTTTWNAVFQVWRDVRPSIAVRITFDRLRVNYNPPLTASGSLELLPGSGGDTALVSILRFAPADVMILDKPFSVTADKKISVEVGAMSATFTVARGNSDYLVLRGPGSLTVSERSLRRANHGRMSQTSFRGDPTSVLRFSDPNELHHFSWSAEWRLAADAEQRIDTPHGRFNVVGGDRTKVTAAGTQKGAQSFSARALLRHAGLRLPLVEGKQHYAEVGRLDFDTGADSEIAFTLARLNGSAEPATSWIALDQNDDRRGELRLDHARLFVVREADMFWGCFRFKGVLLRLCGDGHCLIADPSQSDRLLRVDLPPQHVIETSFARQLPLLPGPNLDAAQLADARDEKKRKCLKKKLAANDKDFGEFSDRYALRYQEAVKKFKDDKKSAEQDKAGDELKKFNRAIKPPSDTIQKLEVVYIGESGLISLFGRRIADLVAFERRQKQLGPRLDDVPLGLGQADVAAVLAEYPKRSWSSGDIEGAITQLLGKAVEISDDQRVIQRAHKGGPFYSAKWLENWKTELPVSQARTAPRRHD